MIETSEPERAEALVRAVAEDLRIGRIEWSVTTELRRAGEANGVYQSNDAARALAAMAELEVEAIRATVPLSVTRAEDVSALRANAQGRFVPVR